MIPVVVSNSPAVRRVSERPVFSSPHTHHSLPPPLFSSPHESQVTSHKPRVFIRLPPLGFSWLSFPHSLLLFSSTCSLFLQTTRGVGGLRTALPPRSLFSAPQARSHPHASAAAPLLRTY